MKQKARASILKAEDKQEALASALMADDDKTEGSCFYTNG